MCFFNSLLHLITCICLNVAGETDFFVCFVAEIRDSSREMRKENQKRRTLPFAAVDDCNRNA